MIRLITMNDILARFVSNMDVPVFGQIFETIKSHRAIQIQELDHFHFSLFFQQSFKSLFFLIIHRKREKDRCYLNSNNEESLFFTIQKNKSWDDIMRFNRDLAKVDF